MSLIRLPNDAEGTFWSLKWLALIKTIDLSIIIAIFEGKTKEKTIKTTIKISLCLNLYVLGHFLSKRWQKWWNSFFQDYLNHLILHWIHIHIFQLDKYWEKWNFGVFCWRFLMKNYICEKNGRTSKISSQSS